MERYRHFKGLSGADVAKTFEKYGIYGYITKYFDSLHIREIVALYRTLTIISAVIQAIVWEGYNLADISKDNKGL